MKRQLMIGTLLVLSGALIASTYLTRGLSAQRRPPQPVPLTQPSTWVPFTADLSITLSDGTREDGSYVRASNGSERWHLMRLSDGRTLDEVSNVNQLRFYRSTGGNVWTRYNIPSRPAIVQWSSASRNLARYQFKLDIANGGSGDIKASTGFEAYQLILPNGTVHLLVPDLNFFPVLQQELGGTLKKYSNVMVGEPTQENFAPPANATISDSPTPMRAAVSTDLHRR